MGRRLVIALSLISILAIGLPACDSDSTGTWPSEL